VSISVHNIQVW